MNGIRNQGGAVAIIAVVMLLVFAVGGATIATLTSTGARTGAGHRQGVQALYLAETALEWAANELASAGNFEDECNGLADKPPLAIGQSAATGARIVSSEFDNGDDPDDEDDDYCNLTILAGAPSLAGAETESQRRLDVAVGRNVGKPGSGGGNTVADDSAWNCGGNASCDGDTATFETPGGKPNPDSKSNRSSSLGDIAEPGSFSSGDEVFLFLTYEGTVTNFGLNRIPRNGDRDCDKDCRAELGEPGSEAVFLGDDLAPEDLNNESSLQFFIEWQGSQLTVTGSCIGTENFCRGNNPAKDWGEGG